MNNDPGLVWADGNRTIVINACSELMEESVVVNTFSGRHRLGLSHDANGSPMIFAIGSDEVCEVLTASKVINIRLSDSIAQFTWMARLLAITFST